MIDKSALRKEMLTLRKNIPDKEKISTTIVNKIINLDIYNRAKVIALYKSMIDEVNTEYLVNYSLNSGKIVLLPRVVEDKLFFSIVGKDTLYRKSSFGILEPITSDFYKDKIDLIIVPGLAFDKENNRLGYGKGYYDRFLHNKDIYKIGVCFYEQVIDNVPYNNRDVKMDLIITNKKT